MLEHGISQDIYFDRKAKYGGMSSGRLKRLTQCEHENTGLKKMVADIILVHHSLKDVGLKTCLFADRLAGHPAGVNLTGDFI